MVTPKQYLAAVVAVLIPLALFQIHHAVWASDSKEPIKNEIAVAAESWISDHIDDIMAARAKEAAAQVALDIILSQRATAEKNLADWGFTYDYTQKKAVPLAK